MSDEDAPDLGAMYRETRERLTSFVNELDDSALATQVPCCPGWSVRDVTAHLAAVAEDVLAGRLTGPPSDEETAAQVARFEGRGQTAILDTLTELGPRFEALIAQLEVWPAVLDVATHEQDIRGAVSEPGARDTEVVRLGSSRLIRWLDPPVPVRVVVEDEEFEVGPDEGPEGDSEPGAQLVLRTNRYQAFRWRLGRRSRAQLADLDWSGDPSPVLDHLVVFGPSKIDIID
ncbi:MAG TPA: maleylpyruvate isomerase family mycothiol-dependent enzyme [Acidimicrobiales bacterium]|nr:maleylpyruvate isomerase family mycothiol-dependent enzyme [Acidimicrobiales bacterium]